MTGTHNNNDTERASLETEVAALNQEITLRLQTIDANFGACFRTITQDIIPRVRGYAAVCDSVLDSASTLAALLQEAGQMQLPLGAGDEPGEPGEPEKPADSAAPPRPLPREEAHPAQIDGADPTVTSTGHILRLPDSSDDETGETGETKASVATPGDDSTLQRASRKRKASLLLHREYASSSPVPQSKRRGDGDDDDTSDLLHVQTSG